MSCMHSIGLYISCVCVLTFTGFSEKSDSVDLPEWQRAAYNDATVKLTQYYCPATAPRFTQPGLGFLQAVRLFDPQQAKILTFNAFFDGIPGYDDKRHLLTSEIAAYKQAVREVDDDVKPLAFWFSNRKRFPNLFELAVRYLSVPGNSVDAERSVSQYTLVNAPQRQNFTDNNLALHVMMVFNARS